jgi:2-isopropylmalate synthase
VEWMHRHLARRDSIIISVHPHNDRGTGVAAAELALMAGAERVEGCLFGNGERTGNVCIVTLAMNLYSQGIGPGLDFSDIDAVRRCAEDCTGLPVHPRHPYAGELVYTAFSGSHQDAIRKGFVAQDPQGGWEVPYLPVDPADVGRSYQAVIRVNSQSGKAGIAYLLERNFGIELPRRLQMELRDAVQAVADTTGKELDAADIYAVLRREYVEPAGPYRYVSHVLEEDTSASERVRIAVETEQGGRRRSFVGEGNGPIDAFVAAIDTGISVRDYHEHAMGEGAGAQAAAYVELRDATGHGVWGVGLDANIVTASLKAIISALNRAARAAEPAASAARAAQA